MERPKVWENGGDLIPMRVDSDTASAASGYKAYSATLSRMDSGRDHIAALDGVRGLAILAVLYYHFGIYAPPGTHTEFEWLYGYAGQVGWVGVNLFFVLSGFLITGILLSTKIHGNYFRNFYARRALRIFPLYYATLIVVRFTFLHGAGDAYVWTYLQNIQIALRGWNATYTAVAHFWSLSVEEQYYLFWPVAVYLFPKRKLLPIAACGAAAAALIRVVLAWHGNERAAYVLTFSRADGLLLGSIVAILYSSPSRAFLCRCALFATPVCGVGFLWLMRAFGTSPDGYVMATAGIATFDLFSAGFLGILITTKETALIQLAELRILRWFGKYSYGMYVLHQPILLATTQAGFTMALLTSRLQSSLLAKLCFDGISLALIALAAVVSWLCIERPFTRLKKHFRYDEPGLENIGSSRRISTINYDSRVGM